MLIIDANVILRFLFQDHDLSEKANEIILNNQVFIFNEVLAEIVYVLQKVYHIERCEIKDGLIQFIENDSVQVHDLNVCIVALNTYCDNNIDFVDALLFAQSKINKKQVVTFDKRLNKLLMSIDGK